MNSNRIAILAIGFLLVFLGACNSVPPNQSGTPTMGVLAQPYPDKDKRFTLLWFNSADSYHMQERLNDGEWRDIFTETSSSRTIVRPGEGKYEYKVKGCSANGICGDWSLVKTLHIHSRIASCDDGNKLWEAGYYVDGDYVVATALWSTSKSGVFKNESTNSEWRVSKKESPTGNGDVFLPEDTSISNSIEFSSSAIMGRINAERLPLNQTPRFISPDYEVPDYPGQRVRPSCVGYFEPYSWDTNGFFPSKKVAVVGDSILSSTLSSTLAENNEKQETAAVYAEYDWAYYADAAGGHTWQDKRNNIRGLATTQPDAIIFALGSNDALGLAGLAFCQSDDYGEYDEAKLFCDRAIFPGFKDADGNQYVSKSKLDKDKNLPAGFHISQIVPPAGMITVQEARDLWVNRQADIAHEVAAINLKPHCTYVVNVRKNINTLYLVLQEEIIDKDTGVITQEVAYVRDSNGNKVGMPNYFPAEAQFVNNWYNLLDSLDESGTFFVLDWDGQSLNKSQEWFERDRFINLSGIPGDFTPITHQDGTQAVGNDELHPNNDGQDFHRTMLFFGVLNCPL